MTNKQTHQNMHKGEQNRPERPATEEARNANPSRQASRGEPSHQKDMHDQHMLDQREAGKRDQDKKH